MTGSAEPRTLAEVLASRRRLRFVGRVAELELFRAELTAAIPAANVLYLHGPGGIGKTFLLDAYAALATAHGARILRVDARDGSAAKDRLAALLEESHQPDPRRLVLIVDTYEKAEPLDEWIRTELLPRLPADTLTVLAGRLPPSEAWSADAGWRELVHTVALRNLGPTESSEMLRNAAIDPALHERIFRITHGHPLALSLLADLIGSGRAAVDVDPLTPDLVGILLRRFVESAPSAAHRRALDVCAVARVTTEAVLRDVLDLDDGHELFEWLRGLSFVESGPDGIFPHDLARDVLEADLRWRDPDGYADVFRAVRRHIHGRLRSAAGRELHRALFDEKFLWRHHPDMAAHLDWTAMGHYHPEPATPGDHRNIVEVVGKWEGHASAAIAQRWLDRQPDSFSVVRRSGRLQGVIALIDLTRAAAEDLAADPGALAAWEYAHRVAPPRPGDVLTQMRFMIDDESYQGPSPTVNLGPIVGIRHWLRTPNLSWDFVTVADPEQWEAFMSFTPLRRAEGADFEVDGRTYGLFGTDLRRRPVDEWLDRATEQALARDYTPVVHEAGSPELVLSRPEFEDAVRQALRDARRPESLARNPLLRSRLVRRSRITPAADALAGVIRDATERLRAHPRDEKLYRAIDRTFLRPAATQERAAEVLGLPLSTYKRHLRQGVERIVADLWDQELSAAWSEPR